MPVADTSNESLDAALTAAGYNLGKVVPSPGRIVVIFVAMLGMMGLAALTYGPVAACLSEMFPPRIRYSSMSIPYHIGSGYFGGFLPFISQFIVAKTGNPYAGLWYTFGGGRDGDDRRRLGIEGNAGGFGRRRFALARAA